MYRSLSSWASSRFRAAPRAFQDANGCTRLGISLLLVPGFTRIQTLHRHGPQIGLRLVLHRTIELFVTSTIPSYHLSLYQHIEIPFFTHHLVFSLPLSITVSHGETAICRCVGGKRKCFNHQHSGLNGCQQNCQKYTSDAESFASVYSLYLA